jgi:hypothetical protein
LPTQKQTVLGLYVTAKEAYEMWLADKNKIKIAVNAMASAGFKIAYSVTVGFEGDRVKDPSSSSYGKRSKNGWRNSGAPWTDNLNPELIWIPSDP